MKGPVLYIALFALLLASCDGKKPKRGGGPVVVATTAWTAAMAEAAGATDVVALAPFEMQHPSEYELRPGDIRTLMNAEIIVYAGYEAMAGRLKKGLGIPAEKMLLVETDYSREAIERSVMSIATRLGTTAAAKENLLEISRAFEEGRAAVAKRDMLGERALVHRFQASLVKELGLQPAALFGPAAPEASEIATAAQKDATLVIDNKHNPVGQPFCEVSRDARYVRLLNFPGQESTRSLADVIRYNVAQIVESD